MKEEQGPRFEENYRQLEATIPSMVRNPGYYKVFDEFVDEDEFGLALDTVLDYLEEDRSASLSISAIAILEWLHSAMCLNPERFHGLIRR